jgi:hypothetical protein
VSNRSSGVAVAMAGKDEFDPSGIAEFAELRLASIHRIFL